jgi:Flp pilus assembly protein CpaB
MSSIVQGMNAEKTNRWLLIGAAVLAVVAGALVFAALANFGGDDDETVTSGEGPDVNVLVANQDISAGTALTEDMFRVAKFKESEVIAGAVSNPSSVVGRTARVNIQENQPLSTAALVQGTTEDDLQDILSSLLDRGLRGIGVATDDVKIVGGHVIPGDRVDVIWTVREKDSPNSDIEFLRIQTMFQNVEVMARTEHTVEGLVVVADADAATDESVTDESATGGTTETQPAPAEVDDPRNTDVNPDDGSDVIVLALTLEQVQTLQMMVDLGEITLALRAFGDEEIVPVEPVRVPVFD